MKNKKSTLLVLVVLVVVLVAGASIVFLSSWTRGEEERESAALKTADITSLSAWTNNKLFKDVPAITGEDIKIGQVTDYGGNMFILDVDGTTYDEYNAYIQLLEQAGLQKIADNGEGLCNSIYTVSFKKDDLTFTVTYSKKISKTYIAACENLPLSEHLIYKDEYVKDNIPGRETTLHMMELYDWGNSLIIQLKNGHFIVHDGGREQDLQYLLEYLEKLAPNGEKPVIEAWFISHTHQDHVGAMLSFTEHQEWIERIFVEGIYFNEPNQAEYEAKSADYANVRYIKLIQGIMKTTEGKKPELYRPQTGQLYYFNDITIEIVHTQEQLHTQNWSGDLNDSSTWCMHNIEGQKVLIAGDADYGSISVVMDAYDKEYFNMDVFVAFHHGINVWEYFTDFISYKTLLYPSPRVGSVYEEGTYAREEWNQYLQSHARESYSFGKGTVVLQFPYAVGTAKIVPLDIDRTELDDLISY